MGTYQLFITLGVLTAYCIGIGTRSINGAGSWRTLIGIGLIFAGVLGVGIQVSLYLISQTQERGQVLTSIV